MSTFAQTITYAQDLLAQAREHRKHHRLPVRDFQDSLDALTRLLETARGLTVDLAHAATEANPDGLSAEAQALLDFLWAPLKACALQLLHAENELPSAIQLCTRLGKHTRGTDFRL